jgi:DNA helicase II / ATP-dependent DNA helicase PcrA
VWAEQQLKPRTSDRPLSFRDGERQAVLVCPTTRDIDACAGGGKTTLLAAKLAILVNRWPHSYQGIAVLSHTNKALEVVLGTLPTSVRTRVQAYPHFVGTIQSFIDRFVAAPVCVQRFAARPSPCDSAEYGRLCVSTAHRHGLRNVISRLGTRQNQTPEDYLGRMVFETCSDQLDCGSLHLKDPTSPTFCEFKELKLAMSRMGRFTYDDMVSLGELALKELAVVIRCVRKRFPVVLIDEAQDTSPRIEQLLEGVFAEESVMQRFGDPNQAIYGSNRECYSHAPASFPRPDALPVSRSTRITPEVAALIGAVTASSHCISSDRTECRQRPHTLFLFTKSSIGRVLPSFGDLVLSHSAFEPEELKDARVVALGGVQKPEEPEDQRRPRDVEKAADPFPKSLCDYWSGFRPRQKSLHSPRECLADYLAFDSVAGGPHTYWTQVERGFVRLAEMCGCGPLVKNKDATSTEILLWLQTERSEFYGWMRRHAYRLWKDRPPLDSSLMNRICTALRRIMEKDLGKCVWSAEADEFAGAAPTLSGRALSVASEEDNVYKHHGADGRRLDIEVGTIHSEKGCEHLATLVLETRYHEHDLRVILPLLLGDGTKPTSARKLGHVRKIHVAMTRPRELLCLAMLDSHVTRPHLEQLRADKKWDVKPV